MKILSWFFGFADKYSELEESYENSRYPFFRFLLVVITAILPTLFFKLFWAIGFGEALLGALLVFVLAVLLWIKTPKDLLILSLVAINHGIWILATRKKSTKTESENPEVDVDNNEKRKKKVKWEKVDSNPVWDFLIGILGLILSVVSFVLPFMLLIGSK